MKTKPDGYWNNKENVFKTAKKYKSRSEFQKGCVAAYKSACKNGWLDEMTWFVRPVVHNKKWTKERVFEEARKYKTRNEFGKGCVSAYDVARKNKWLDEMTWFVDGRTLLLTNKDNCVYRYYWEETNAIYIGRTLTKRQKDRDNEHIFDKRDTVFKHSKGNDIAVPPMEIIEDSLTLKESIEKEGYWVEYYREKGYNILNKAKTGAIGSIGKGKWTKERVFAEARKYRTRSEFQKGCYVGYQVSHKRGWIKEMDWFVCGRKPRKWTKEKLFEEARKYKTRNEFQKNACGAYCAALDKGWIKEMDWFVDGRIIKWTKERVFAEAKKYNTKKEFQKGCATAYGIARKNKWLDEMTWFVEIRKPFGYWTKENVFAEAKKYRTRGEFQNGCKYTYYVACKNGWLDEIFPKHHSH